MKLYDFPGAPSPRKVAMFIAEKGIEVPRETVNLRERAQLEPQYLSRNPTGTVPLLELDDGTRLTESLAICHYLEQVHPEPNLMGRDARESALVLMWTDIQTFEGYLAMQEVLRNRSSAFAGRSLPLPESYAQIPELVERGKRRAEAHFDRMDRRLAESAFVASDRFTYADIVGYVYAAFAERALKQDPGESRPALRRWRERIAERPSAQAGA